MEDKYLASICKQIYQRFPEVVGSRPTVQAQKLSLDNGEASPRYLLIFKGLRTTADGKSINRIVRVVASERGQILKVTTSR